MQPSVLKHDRKRIGNGGQSCFVATLAASETVSPVNRSAASAKMDCDPFRNILQDVFSVGQESLEEKNIRKRVDVDDYCLLELSIRFLRILAARWS